MKVASPRVMPLGPFVSDWTRQVGLGKATSVKGAFCGRTRGRWVKAWKLSFVETCESGPLIPSNPDVFHHLA
jgi:hypothetical protein